jgi:CAAX prenyl protease-like protein
VLVFGIWMGLEWALPGASATSPIPPSLAELPAGLAAVWLLCRVLGSVITVPIAEELAFRGYLLRRLLSPNFADLSTVRFTWLSFVVSSVLFSALHGRGLAGTVAGLCYAWALSRRGREEDAIVAHAITNALIAAEVLILGHWGLWG